MEQIIPLVLMIFMLVLIMYVALKLTVKRFKKPNNAVGIVMQKKVRQMNIACQKNI